MTNPPDASQSNSAPSSSPAQETAADSTQNGSSSLAKTPSKSQGGTQGASNSVERPTKKRSFRLAPSFSSSGSKQKPSSTSLQDAAERNSRTSQQQLETSRRTSSRASSRRSRRTRTSENAHDSAPKVAIQEADDNPPSKEQSKPKGASKVFAFFSCCTSSGVDHDEQVLPAKKSVVSRSNQGGRAVTPVQKAETGAIQASSSDVRDQSTSDEKTELTEDTGQQLPATDNHTNKTIAATTKNEKEEATGLAPSEQDNGTVSSAADAAGSSLTTSGAAAAETSTSENASCYKPADKVISKQHPLPESRTEQDQETGPVIMHDTTAAESRPVSQDPVTSAGNETIQQHSIPPPPPLTSVAIAHDAVTPATLPENRQYLLPPIQYHLKNRKCLVLDLDETLVHSSFKVLDRADFTIPVEIEGQYHNIYVIKRPGVDQFMKRVGELYEVVVFTASVAKYGDPLLDQLDIHDVVHHRLFRDSCYNHQGNFVKDLSQVGRELKETIIIDNSPTSYIFHPQHAIPISSWFSDAHDNELLDLIPVLEDMAGPQICDVSLVLDVTI